MTNFASKPPVAPEISSRPRRSVLYLSASAISLGAAIAFAAAVDVAPDRAQAQVIYTGWTTSGANHTLHNTSSGTTLNNNFHIIASELGNLQTDQFSTAASLAGVSTSLTGVSSSVAAISSSLSGVSTSLGGVSTSVAGQC